MSASILVGYDPRARVRAPVDFGIALARLTGAKLIVASVQAGVPAMPGPPTPYGAGQIDDDLIADCTEALEQVEPELRAHALTTNASASAA